MRRVLHILKLIPLGILFGGLRYLYLLLFAESAFSYSLSKRPLPSCFSLAPTVCLMTEYRALAAPSGVYLLILRDNDREYSFPFFHAQISDSANYGLSCLFASRFQF